MERGQGSRRVFGANALAAAVSDGPWSDVAERVLGGDLAVVLADVTPMRGVVLTPLTNFALQDRGAATTAILSSVGAFQKLKRLRSNPSVALAFHTREHGRSADPSYVLLQGSASFSAVPDRRWLESITPNWDRFMGPRDTGLWGWWMNAYQWERIGVTIGVERVIEWPDLACCEVPIVHGEPLATVDPPVQREPKLGVAPRVEPSKIAGDIARLPHALLGWVDADGRPVVVPVGVIRSDERGVTLSVAPGLVPAGGRRAGLIAHWFTEGVLGQEQRSGTGWLEAEPGSTEVLYAPHSRHGYRLPPSKLLYRLAVGAMTRVGLRRERRSGFLTADPTPPTDQRNDLP